MARARSKSEAPPYLALYPLRMLGDPAFVGMSTEAAGAYTRLWLFSWGQHPGGTLPKDDAVLARLANLSELRWSAIRAEVLAGFEEAGDRWAIRWVLDEYRRVTGAIRDKSKAGKLSAEKRWGKPKGSAVTDPSHTHGSDVLAEQSRREEKKTLPAPPSPPPVLVRPPRDVQAALVEKRIGHPALAALLACEALTVEWIDRAWDEVKSDPSVRDRPSVFLAKACEHLGIEIPKRKATPIRRDVHHAMRVVEQARRNQGISR